MASGIESLKLLSHLQAASASEDAVAGAKQTEKPKSTTRQQTSLTAQSEWYTQAFVKFAKYTFGATSPNI